MKQLKTGLEAGEKILRQSSAWLARWGWVRRGTLVLTNRRIVFESGHSVRQVRLADIQFVDPDWCRLYGLLPFSPAVIIVETRDVERFRFTVPVAQRDAWLGAVKLACYEARERRGSAGRRGFGAPVTQP